MFLQNFTIKQSLKQSSLLLVKLKVCLSYLIFFAILSFIICLSLLRFIPNILEAIGVSLVILVPIIILVNEDFRSNLSLAKYVFNSKGKTFSSITNGEGYSMLSLPLMEYLIYETSLFDSVTYFSKIKNKTSTIELMKNETHKPHYFFKRRRYGFQTRESELYIDSIHDLVTSDLMNTTLNPVLIKNRSK